MKNKNLLIAQLNHIKEYVEIIDTLDTIEWWNWAYDRREDALKLILAGRKEMHTITIPDIKARHQIGKGDPA